MCRMRKMVNLLKTKALLISEKRFDDLVETSSVSIVGSYADLRKSVVGANPYIEYIIEPVDISGTKIDIVIISNEKDVYKLVEYPFKKRRGE